MSSRIRIYIFSATVALVAALSTSCANRPTSVSDVPPPHFQCKAEDSIPIDLARFAKLPENYLGKCIRARGYRWADSLFRDLETMYTLKGDISGEIQLHLKPASDEDYDEFLTFQRTREHGEVVGLAYTCEEAERRDAEQFKILQAEAESRGQVLITADGGTCHHINVPRGRATLFVSSWRPTKGLLLSFVGADAARKYGNLFELRDEWEYAGEVKSIVQPWFDAVRAKNEGYFASSHPYSERRIHALLTSDRSPVKFLVGMPERPIKYFSVNFQWPADLEKPTYQALGCVCKSGDCSGRWPITAGDADSGFWNDLPYICIHLIRLESEDPPAYIDSDYLLP